jgi:hypothetical protein
MARDGGGRLVVGRDGGVNHHVSGACAWKELLSAPGFFYRPPDFYRSGAVRVATAVTAVYR